MTYKLLITTKCATGHYENPNRAYGGERFKADNVHMVSKLVEFDTEKEAEDAIHEIEKMNMPKPWWEETEYQRLWKSRRKAKEAA